MSERQLLPGSPFDVEDGELPSEQAAAKRFAEDITAFSVLPFEAEKQLVDRDHVAMQQHVWGLRDDHMRPIELSTDGRKA